MASAGSAFSPSASLLFSQPKLRAPKNPVTHNHIFKICAIEGTNGGKLVANPTVSVSETTSFGFKNLTETFWVDVHKAEGRPLNVPLSKPLTVAVSTSNESVENVAIRVELGNGCVGWGEAPSVTPEDQPLALAKAGEACEFLRRSPPMTLNLVLDEIGGILPGHEFASVRAGVEMALIDAVANSIEVPLWRLFGGVSNSVTSSITIPVVSPVEASKVALRYCKQGFNAFKLNMSKSLNADMEILQAIRTVHPNCSFILDANGGYSPKEAIEILEKLHGMGVIPVLFEQPVRRHDLDGLGYVSSVAREEYGTSVAADEACQNLSDVSRIIKENLVDVINIKLAKYGVLGATKIVEEARNSGLDLIISGLEETRLATGFAGHFAAGLGCFKFVDLYSPIVLSRDPVVGGYEVSGALYKFNNARGQGGFLNWEIIAWDVVFLEYQTVEDRKE